MISGISFSESERILLSDDDLGVRSGFFGGCSPFCCVSGAGCVDGAGVASSSSCPLEV